MINIIGKRYIFFIISLVVIVPGLIILFYMSSKNELPLAVDFTGGSLLEVRFDTALPQPADIIGLYETLGVSDAQVQTTSTGSYVIRSSELSEEARSSVVDSLKDSFNSEVTVLRFENVGPTIGNEVTARAGIAVAVAVLIVTVYLTFAFRGVPHSF
jgi:preprotein translocase subunit SecF